MTNTSDLGFWWKSGYAAKVLSTVYEKYIMDSDEFSRQWEMNSQHVDINCKDHGVLTKLEFAKESPDQLFMKWSCVSFPGLVVDTSNEYKTVIDVHAKFDHIHNLMQFDYNKYAKSGCTKGKKFSLGNQPTISSPSTPSSRCSSGTTSFTSTATA